MLLKTILNSGSSEFSVDGAEVGHNERGWQSYNLRSSEIPVLPI